MSARDWKVCPRCRRIHAERKAELEKQVRASYGSLALDEFDALRQQAAQPFDETPTLRIDYELYLDDNGKFSVWYGATCDACGFNFRFNHEEQVAA